MIAIKVKQFFQMLCLIPGSDDELKTLLNYLQSSAKFEHLGEPFI